VLFFFLRGDNGLVCIGVFWFCFFGNSFFKQEMLLRKE
jgi:hypothetical protein